jgi:hypothetical protein
MKSILNSKELAWLLDVKKSEAAAKIIYCHNKAVDETGVGVKFSEEYDKKGKLVDLICRTSISNLEKYGGLTYLRFAITDIQENFLTRSQTRGYILNYPQQKMNRKGKDGSMPKSISIPSPLNNFLSTKTKQDIIEIWQTQYPYFTGKFKAI